jgi:hypothetical protein
MNFKLPDPEQFNIKDCIIAGDECVLITPKDMSVEWNEDNKIFRSSIWRKSDMHPVSLGFKKFTNLGEQPTFEPMDDYDDLEFVRKLDGSLLIVSKYKGELIVRTRGTIDASRLENGHEIEFLKNKYPEVFDNFWLDSERYSLLFEWTTPTNRIVLKESEEPTLWLTGIVNHKDTYDPFLQWMGCSQKMYTYFTQKDLDDLAEYLEVSRPERYTLNLQNVAEYLKDETSIEGVVIYANGGQILKKVKTPSYLYKHRVFTGVKTVDHLFDLFVEHGCSNRENFETLLATNYDWELVEALKNLMDELYTKWDEVLEKKNQIQSFVKNVNALDLSRKDIASVIIQNYKDLSGLAFALLDGKTIPPHKLWKTLTNSCN